MLTTRSYYRKESAAVAHKLDANSQPNKTFIKIYFIAKHLDYNTVITTPLLRHQRFQKVSRSMVFHQHQMLVNESHSLFQSCQERLK